MPWHEKWLSDAPPAHEKAEAQEVIVKRVTPAEAGGAGASDVERNLG